MPESLTFVTPRPVGGQAVVEGVMMRGDDLYSVSVRRADGTIETETWPNPSATQRFSKIPLLRGVVSLVESMVIGYRALSFSADKAEQDLSEDEGEAGGLVKAVMWLVGTLVTIGILALFLFVPGFVARGLVGSGSALVFSLVEGGLRLSIFVSYLALIGMMPDVRRVFQYHGAEHKAIAAYESRRPLTPEEAQRFSTRHLRCGTSFLLLVIVLSILIHIAFGKPDGWVLVASRLFSIPIVAGISFEVVRFAANHPNAVLTRMTMAPGLALQKLTTRQPGLDQLEVAIASLEAVLSVEQLEAARHPELAFSL